MNNILGTLSLFFLAGCVPPSQRAWVSAQEERISESQEISTAEQVKAKTKVTYDPFDKTTWFKGPQHIELADTFNSAYNGVEHVSASIDAFIRPNEASIVLGVSIVHPNGRAPFRLERCLILGGEELPCQVVCKDLFGGGDTIEIALTRLNEDQVIKFGKYGLKAKYYGADGSIEAGLPAFYFTGCADALRGYFE